MGRVVERKTGRIGAFWRGCELYHKGAFDEQQHFNRQRLASLNNLATYAEDLVAEGNNETTRVFL